MFKNDNSYYAYLLISLVLLGVGIYVYNINPAAYTLQEAFTLLVPFQVKSVVLIVTLLITTINSVYFVLYSLKRAWKMFSSYDFTQGILSLILALLMGISIYYFGKSAIIKFAGLVFVVVLFLLYTQSGDTPNTRSRYRN